MISEEVANETNTNKNSSNIMENTKYEQTVSNSNNQSIRYGGTSNEDAQLFRREQGQSRINENR